MNNIFKTRYRYPLALTSQYYFCGMPLRLDSYRGCPSACVYCFTQSRSGNFNNGFQLAKPDLIRNWFNLALYKCIQPTNVKIECLQRRMPVHFGGMSDPLLIPESFKDITLEILKVLDEFKYPTLISTKANIVNNVEYADIILGKSHFALQISFSTFDDYIASLVEPHAPPPSQRIEGAKIAIRNGNWISCRLQPYIPGQNINDLVCYIKSLGFNHITFEHFKMPFDSTIELKKLDKAFNSNLSEIFSSENKIKRGREFEIQNDIRFEGIKEFLKAARNNEIPIGIGDNGFQHLSTTDCCCGIDSLPGFENWFKHNNTVAMRRTLNNHFIQYESIENEWSPQLSISEMINSKTRLRNSYNNIENQIKTHWLFNKQFSPEMFYNVKSEKVGNSYRYYIDDSS